MKPKQFYWNIESLWEKYSEESSVFVNLKTENTFDFTSSKNPVFFDDNENNKPYCGLQNDAQIIVRKDLKEEKKTKKIFLTDNHHKVLGFLFNEFLEKKQKITLIHIDAHRDDAIFQNYKKCRFEIQEVKNFIHDFLSDLSEERSNETPQKIIDYIHIIQKNCRISDYLDVALHLGFVENVISVTQTSDFENMQNMQDIENLHNRDSKNIILNLDIDIYGPEGDAVSVNLKTEIIAKSWKIANAVCIATSPAFIEETMAEKIITIFTA